MSAHFAPRRAAKAGGASAAPCKPSVLVKSNSREHPGTVFRPETLDEAREYYANPPVGKKEWY